MRIVASAAAFAACVSLGGNGWATDLSLKDPPEYEYSELSLVLPGFYVGVNLGAAKTNVDIGDTYNYVADPFAANSFDNTGAIAGVEIGYNFQSGNIVYGLSAGVGYMDISGSVSADLPQSIPGDKRTDINGTYEAEGGLFGELTARLGYASGRSLFYVKGGGAFLNTDFSSDYVGKNCTFTKQCSGTPNSPSKFGFENSDTLMGWTVGVGVEYALTSNWSLKAEYQHFDFGTQSFDYSGEYKFVNNGNCGKCLSELSGSTDVDYTVDAIRIGVNYRFNGGQD